MAHKRRSTQTVPKGRAAVDPYDQAVVFRTDHWANRGPEKRKTVRVMLRTQCWPPIIL